MKNYFENFFRTTLKNEDPGGLPEKKRREILDMAAGVRQRPFSFRLFYPMAFAAVILLIAGVFYYERMESPNAQIVQRELDRYEELETEIVSFATEGEDILSDL